MDFLSENLQPEVEHWVGPSTDKTCPSVTPSPHHLVRSCASTPGRM